LTVKQKVITDGSVCKTCMNVKHVYAWIKWIVALIFDYEHKKEDCSVNFMYIKSA
jgi:hypothetical protein